MNIRQDVTLAPYTTFGIGGPADYFIVAHSSDELIQAVEYAQEKKLSFFILGTGANILIGDKGFRGVVIKNEAQGFEVQNSSHNSLLSITAESGATIRDLITFTAEKGLSGLEHYA